jgi:diaminohydroxyphosphoribosylaminopyrimidine deaminase/5-amino-6-(5-phosphoribosylamino)uracil reductase
MNTALMLARPMLGRTAPNPAVGCVVVKRGRIVGRGATAAGGRPHAETQALAQAGGRARDATAYVTFEPCAHQGKTPPCAQALIDAGVARVVIGCLDPYPAVRGRGAARLRRAGIAVVTGVMEAECRRLNEGFICRVTKGRPFVLLKMALTLDGRIAAPGLRWISAAASRQLVHRWRNECDLVMVGAGTVIADNPRLTCRMEGGRDPVRLIVDAGLRVSPDALIFHQHSAAPTLVATVAARAARARVRYAFPNVEILQTEEGPQGVDLKDLMRQLAARGWSRVLLEGGARLAGSALAAGLVDRLAFFLAPRIAGAGLPAVAGLNPGGAEIVNMAVQRSGSDLLVEAELRGRGVRRTSPTHR